MSHLPLDPARTVPPPGADETARDDADRTIPPPGTTTPPGASPSATATSWRALDLVGARLGPWVLDERLGEGAWGAVFRAHDAARPSVRAAIKVPKLGDTARAPRTVARFREEVETLRRVHESGVSRHVVGFLGAEAEARPYPWLALELVEGTDLGAELKHRKRFPIREALRLGIGILDGLAEAHRAGVVHRDLKPENVLMSDAGEIRVADFGIARLVDRAKGEDGVEEALTAAGEMVGTPYYMSPEQISGKADQRGDLYSFGAMLFSLVAGRPPFRGTSVSMVYAHLSVPAPPLSDFAVDVPPRLSTLVGRLLSKDPAERPDARQAQGELRDVLRLLDTPAENSRETAAVALELKEGDEVGDYLIEREVGRGGMGIVYAARTTGGDRIALKVAGFVFTTQEAARKQLLRDGENAIEITRSHPHPAVARVHGVGEAIVRGVPIVYLVSELVEGPSLARFVAENGPIPERIALDLALGIAEGLAAIHDAGFLHLDLTPGNVLLEGPFDGGDPWAALEKATPKIVDFGVSRRIESETIRGVEGNPGYMSPEQCEGHAQTRASDVYTLGATLYHATTGRPVFTGEPLAVMARQRSELPAFADLEDPRLGLDLALAIHRCLFKSPEHRYAAATDLAADLRLVGTPRFPRSELKHAWERERNALGRRTSRRTGLVAGIALVVMTLSIGVGIYFVREASQAQRQAASARASALSEQLVGRIEGAAANQLPGIVLDIERLGRDLPDDARARQGQLDAHASDLVEKLSRDVRRQADTLPAEPVAIRSTLERELDRRDLAALRAAAHQAPTWAANVTISAAGRPVHLTDSLDEIGREIASLIALCDVGALVRAEDWDRGEAALAALPPALPVALAPREAVAAQLTAGTGALDEAAFRAVQVARDQLERNRIPDAEEGLAAFARAHPHLASRARAARVFEKARAEVHAARTSHPLETLAEEERLKVEARLAGNGVLELPAGRLSGGDPERARRELDRAFSDCTAFLARVEEGKGRFRDTNAGGRIAERLVGLEKTYAVLAASAWESWEGGLASVWSGTETPAKYDALARGYRDFPSVWERAGDSLVSLPGTTRSLVEVRQAALARVRDARERAALRLLEESEAALGRGHHVERAADLASAAGSFGEPARPEIGARLALVAKEVALFRRLDLELVPVDVPAGYLVGARNQRLYPEHAIETKASRLQVDAFETRVETYRLFLEFVETFGPSSQAVKDVEERDQPPRSHKPDEPMWGLEAQSPEHPVVGVSWFDASACARWAGRRLPSADEWELIARGASRDADRFRAWRDGAARRGFSGAAPLDVGAAGERSDWGVFDTAGNVSEWTSTPRPGKGFVYCGASFASPPLVELQQLFQRSFGAATDRKRSLGFRGVLEENAP